MASERSLGVAARCWCEPTTEYLTMMPALAEVFAERLDEYFDMIEFGWGIIANAGGGNWDRETPDWKQAAEQWREKYHVLLDETRVPVIEGQAS